MIGFFSDFLHIKIRFPMGEYAAKPREQGLCKFYG